MLVEFRRTVVQVAKYPGYVVDAMLTTQDELNSNYKDSETGIRPIEVRERRLARRVGSVVFNLAFAMTDFIEGLTLQGRRNQAHRVHPFTEIGPEGIRKHQKP